MCKISEEEIKHHATIIRNQICLNSKMLDRYQLSELQGGIINNQAALRFKIPAGYVIIAYNPMDYYDIWVISVKQVQFRSDIYNDEIWDALNYMFEFPSSENEKLPKFVPVFNLDLKERGRLYTMCEESKISLSTTLISGKIISNVMALLEMLYLNADKECLDMIEKQFEKIPTYDEKLNFLNYMLKAINL